MNLYAELTPCDDLVIDARKPRYSLHSTSEVAHFTLFGQPPYQYPCASQRIHKACNIINPLHLRPDVGYPDTMFTKIKSSLKLHKARRSTGDLPIAEHVCHACGQTLIQSDDNIDTFAARPYELYEHRDRNRASWNSSGFSDSGYGSLSNSQDFSPLVQQGVSQPEVPTQPFARRSTTHSPDTYSDDDEFDLSASARTTEPAGFETPEYMHGFNSPPPSLDSVPEKRKSASRYARLNELPVASPGTIPSQHAALEAEIIQDESRSDRKRRTLQSLESLIVRPSSFGRLGIRRTRND